MQIPFGKQKGQPIDSLSTSRLMWLISQDAIRHARWPFIVAALDILRSRFEDPAALLAELKMDNPPPKYWKATTPPAEKAEKLRKVEAQRAIEKAQRLADIRVRNAALRAEREQPINAAEYLRRHKAGSDLV